VATVRPATLHLRHVFVCVASQAGKQFDGGFVFIDGVYAGKLESFFPADELTFDSLNQLFKQDQQSRAEQ
jgi:hypothetical protein